MKEYYISIDNVDAAIEYFRSASFDTDDMLFLFLMSKHLGITATFPVTYRSVTDEKKKEYLHAIWMLAGLFDSSETCANRGLLFPTAFKNVQLYQPGSSFTGVLGRVKDTIEKKNINVPIYNDNNSNLTLKNNYRDLIKDSYLKGNKISLSYLAAWVFRYTSFEFDILPSPHQFTRVVEKLIRKFFKITKNDLLWLFEDDFSTLKLVPSDSGITGDQIRTKFVFKEAPDVKPATTGTDTQVSIIGNDIVERYLAMNGDNPNDIDIFNILKLKKQIVLTGVPGVGKSRFTDSLCKKLKENGDKVFKETKIVQFHAGYSYEDFIGGETLDSDDGVPKVKPHIGVFLEFANKASNDKDYDYLFIIDELNRGNIAEIFGETILALDRNYEVELTRNYKGISKLKLPENLYIVGTMNTSDRNIAFLDLAIRRRFAFIPLYPNYDFLSENISINGYSIDLGNVLRIINQRILETLKDSEMLLGQSYFIPPVNDEGKYIWEFSDFKNQFNFVLLPTIKEYSFNDPAALVTILGDHLSDSIQDIDDFISAFLAEFK